MPIVSCPACQVDIDVAKDKVFFRGQIVCSSCGAKLDIINEHPLRVEWSPGKRGIGWISEWLTRESSEKV